MRILGIDPGVATVGYGLIDYFGNKSITVDYGAITTAPHQPMVKRLNEIFNTISKIIRKHKPDEIAIEELFFAKNVKTAMMVSQARGVIMLAAARKGYLDINEYTPMEVKMALVGYGRADKSQIQQMVKVILSLREIPKPDDTADALAIAICHAHSRRRNPK